MEDQPERAVSQHIRAVPFVWLAVSTRPAGSSDCGFIECNSIPLLSWAAGWPDKPGSRWLGSHAASSKEHVEAAVAATTRDSCRMSAA